MLINDLVGMLEDLPRTLAARLGDWLFVGLAAVVWRRREKPPPGRARPRRPKSGCDRRPAFARRPGR